MTYLDSQSRPVNTPCSYIGNIGRRVYLTMWHGHWHVNHALYVDQAHTTLNLGILNPIVALSFAAAILTDTEGEWGE